VNVTISARARSRIRSGLLLLLVSVALTRMAAAQGDNPAQAAIRGALTHWMEAFNAGDAAKVCGLFAPDLIAQVRGQPDRSYTDLCDLLKRSLSDPTKTYTYALVLKEILVAGDVAVVRLTWTLKVRHKDTGKEVTSDEFGIDIFRRQADGSWKIARFISYDASP
jgi:steroid delta-isomerase